MKRKATTQKTSGKDKKTKKAPVKQHAAAKSNLPAAWNPVGAEIKAVDIVLGGLNCNAGGGGAEVVALLNGVQAGAGFFNRVGARIEMRNLHIRGVLRNAATGVQDTCRLAVVYDRQPTNGLPAFNTIFQSRDQAGTAATTGVSEINLDNRDRFIILRDVQYFTPAVTNTAGVLTNGPNYPGSDQESDVNIFIKLKGLGTHFNSTATPVTIANIATGALYIVVWSVINAASWQFYIGTRLRYDDK